MEPGSSADLEADGAFSVAAAAVASLAGGGSESGAPSTGLRTTIGIFRSSFWRGGRDMRSGCAAGGFDPSEGWARSRISSKVGCALFFSGSFFCGAGFGSSTLAPERISSKLGCLRALFCCSSWDSGLSLIERLVSPVGLGARVIPQTRSGSDAPPPGGLRFRVQLAQRGEKAHLVGKPGLAHALPAHDHPSAGLAS